MKRRLCIAMNNSGTPKHVCFYSNKCRWSEGFIKAIAQTPFKNDVHFICVDVKPDGSRAKLPAWLKKVPTLVVRGEDEPRTDSAVMNWLSEQRLLGQKDGAGGAGAAEPEPWISGEMGGSFTKGFSFLGGNDTNDAPIGNFEFLNGNSAAGTKTASDMPGGGLGARAQSKSKKEELFDKQMEEYMKQRGNGMPQAPLRQ
jgi:hypothetical protein